MNFLQDRTFLLKLNQHKVKTYYAAILVLDFETEAPIARLEGKIVSGNLNVAANAPVRRTASFRLISDDSTYNIADVNNLIAIDKKISLSIGIENPFTYDEKYKLYGETLWFKQGVFVITQASSSISSTGLSLSLSLQDKMAFLNGTCGGTLPANTSLHDREIYDKDGNKTVEHPLIKQIITEVVHHFGGEHPSRIIVEDVPDVGRQVVEYIGKDPISFNFLDEKSGRQEVNGNFTFENPPPPGFETTFYKGETVGYKETPLTYPGELIMKEGSTVVQVLDSIAKTLGNFTFYYDIDGFFHFRHKNNFLATGNTPLNLSPQEDRDLQQLYCPRYSPNLLLNEFSDASLLKSISFNPNYSNIKNDFVYWGSRKSKDKKETLVRYHMAIDKRPRDIPKPKTEDEKLAIGSNYSLCHKSIIQVLDSEDNIIRYQLRDDLINGGEKFGKLVAPALDEVFPKDPEAHFNWREELYRRALLAYGSSTEGSYYDQELLVEWRAIFDPTSTRDQGPTSFQSRWEGKYGVADGNDSAVLPWRGYNLDAILNPEKLRYWLDIIDSSANIGQYSVSRIGRRTCVTNDSKVNQVFAREIPDLVFVEMPTNDKNLQEFYNELARNYASIGQAYSIVQPDQAAYFKPINSYGTCYEGIRDQLYQKLVYNSGISMASIPILYLDADTMVRVNFKDKGVQGDFVVNTIGFSFGQNPSMNISCQEAIVVV